MQYKVLMIENFLPGNKYSLELAKRLCSFVDLTLITTKNCGLYAETLPFGLLKLLYAKSSKGKIHLLKEYLCSLRDLEQEIVQGGYDVIHVQTVKKEGIELPLIQKASKKSGVPVVCTVHNVDPHEHSEKGKRARRRWYDFCSALIVHNEASARELRIRYEADMSKLYVVPHGVYSVEKDSPQLLVRENDGTHFLFFGSIREYKGVDLLLEAIDRIPRERLKDMRFIIAGRQYPALYEFDLANRIEQLDLKKVVETRIRRIPDDEVSSLFEWADFAVFPYREIYGSGALLMSYSYSVPVIASNLPTFLEETENGSTGLLFKAEDPDSLASALLEACSIPSEEKSKMESEIVRLVREKFNWERSASAIAEAYTAAAKSRS